MSARDRIVSAIFHVVRNAVAIVFVCAPIPWHEIAGHGAVGVLCGGKVTRVQLFGLQVVPDFRWTGTREGLGFCDHSGIRSQWCAHLTDLAGSMSTFIVAAIAAYVLWKYRPRGLKFAALICLSIWCMDLFTFTLPSFGVRRYIWSGTRYSEPYKAAVALGIPGALFQILVLVGTFAVLLTTGLSIWRRIKNAPQA
jgi:hypothetical protein